MTHPLQDLLRDATRLTRAGRLAEATAAIQQALGGVAAPWSAAPPADVIDVQAVELPAGVATDAPAADPSPPPGVPLRIDGVHRLGGLQRSYQLHLPPARAGQRPPLLVMLHGCTQDPDDFAAGTGMTALAAAQGIAVLYPAQAADANPQRCWNWFKHSHQQPGRGEAALIASLALAMVRQHGLDADRVWIAGLSAGGAMAAQVAALHPAQFAAVGVHSGLAPGAAQDLPAGLAAMRQGAAAPARLPVPAIVFHGDRDGTVHPRNGEQVFEAAVQGAADAAAQTLRQTGASAAGQRYTRLQHGAPGQPPRAELWLLHGAGHAWSGGLPAGSHTDARGVDASAELLRFFASHRRGRG